MDSVQTILAAKRLRWLGHIDRLPDHRLPKQVLYGELCKGSRPLGCPIKRFKDTCKRDLQAFHIPVDKWRELAQKRLAWKSSVRTGASSFEEGRRDHARGKRAKRKATKSGGKKKSAETQVEPPPTETSTWTCELCSRVCRSRIGLYSHKRKCLSTPAS